METQELKKYLARFSIAGLLAGTGLVIGFGTSNAVDNSNGGGGTGITTEQSMTKSGGSESKATPTSEPTPTGG